MTHTYSLLIVSPKTYREVRIALVEANWHQAIQHDGDEEVLDLHGLGLVNSNVPHGTMNDDLLCGTLESVIYSFWLFVDECLHMADDWLDFDWRGRFCTWCHRKD